MEGEEGGVCDDKEKEKDKTTVFSGDYKHFKRRSQSVERLIASKHPGKVPLRRNFCV